MVRLSSCSSEITTNSADPFSASHHPLATPPASNRSISLSRSPLHCRCVCCTILHHDRLIPPLPQSDSVPGQPIHMKITTYSSQFDVRRERPPRPLCGALRLSRPIHLLIALQQISGVCLLAVSPSPLQVALFNEALGSVGPFISRRLDIACSPTVQLQIGSPRPDADVRFLVCTWSMKTLPESHSVVWYALICPFWLDFPCICSPAKIAYSPGLKRLQCLVLYALYLVISSFLSLAGVRLR